MTDTRIRHTKDYIRSFLNDTISIKVITEEIKKRLPIVITSTYDCFSTAIMGVDVNLYYPKDEKSITPAKVQHHLEMAANKTNIPSIVVLADIPSYNIKRLIEQRVNFIIVDKQMFVPSLLLDLRKMPSKNKDIKEEIPALAQCIILYELQNGIMSYPVADIPQLFGTSYSTSNRAIRWLQSKGFFIPIRTNKNIQFCVAGKELWDMALPYFTSPVERTIQVDELPNNVLKSKKEDDVVYVASKEEVKRLVEKTNGKYKVEIWKYSPYVLSKDKIHADLFSSYLSVKDTDNNDLIDQVENLLESR